MHVTTHSKDGATWVTWHHLYCVFTYSYSLLIEENICDCRNVSVRLPCVYLCISSGDLLIFSARVSSFYSYFCVIHNSVLSPSTRTTLSSHSSTKNTTLDKKVNILPFQHSFKSIYKFRRKLK